MPLIDIDDQGRERPLRRLDHETEFLATWLTLSDTDRAAIEHEINQRLDDILASPDPKWGTITNTAIEGGKASPETNRRGDWTGTVFAPIYDACGANETLAGMFFGNVWKMVIIKRPENWIGLRTDPTLPSRGVTLGGKTYFVPHKEAGTESLANR